MEKETQSRDCKSPAQLPLKRKSDLVPVEEGEDERTVKQQKPDAPPLEELGDASLDEKKGGTDQNGNADGEKKEFVLPAVDKGKGKMVVEDEEGCDEEGGDEEGGDEEGGNEEGGDEEGGDEEGGNEEGGDEEEDDQESGDSDDDDEDETSKDVEAYLADDSLTEMDVDNILQERTRPRHSLKLGASVMEGKKDDVEDDGDYCEDEDDDDDDEEEEEEEEDIKETEEEKDGEQEEEEEKQESN